MAKPKVPSKASKGSSLANYVLRKRQPLKENNYILESDATATSKRRAYWFNVAKGKLEKYIAANRDPFNIIVAGNKSTEGDFYVMPYPAIKHLLTEETLSQSKNGHNRWIGTIKDHRLRFKNSSAIDVCDYYGRLDLLTEPSVTPQSEEEENDYAIETRKVEINQRLKQSVFRQRVLTNFKGRCCLTGIAEPELLMASHIVPWAERVDSRLDPGNGLCLSVLVDRLFDEGFITFDDGLRVIVTPQIKSLSRHFRKLA